MRACRAGVYERQSCRVLPIDVLVRAAQVVVADELVAIECQRGRSRVDIDSASVQFRMVAIKNAVCQNTYRARTQLKGSTMVDCIVARQGESVMFSAAELEDASTPPPYTAPLLKIVTRISDTPDEAPTPRPPP